MFIPLVCFSVVSWLFRCRSCDNSCLGDEEVDHQCHCTSFHNITQSPWSATHKDSRCSFIISHSMKRSFQSFMKCDIGSSTQKHVSYPHRLLVLQRESMLRGRRKNWSKTEHEFLKRVHCCVVGQLRKDHDHRFQKSPHADIFHSTLNLLRHMLDFCFFLFEQQTFCEITAWICGSDNHAFNFSSEDFDHVWRSSCEDAC